jgi:chromosome segregation ATPase
MTQSTDRDIQEIKSAIDSNTKSIADLITSFSGLREEMCVGFTRIEGRINDVETKLEGQIHSLETKLEGKIETVNSKLGNLESSTQKIPDLAETVEAPRST